MLDSSNFRRAVKLTAPVFFGYIAIGIPFGLMVVNAGFPWWLAVVMSLLIYSGTGQYIGIALFSSGLANASSFWASLLTFVSIEFFIGLRHIFYSLSLLETYRNTGKWKFPLIFTITDETFALISSCNIPRDADKGAYLAVISIFDYSYWVLGTLIGAIIGNFIPDGYLNGVDFALTALFIVLMINQIKASKDFLPSLVGILAACLATALSYIKINGKIILPSQHLILTGLCLGIVVMILLRGKSAKSKKSEGDEK
ncbi:MAG: AzlC family ABC transporter permease [Treponema sp.]|uniref:AzlC family ABC transporter permease n=1 Tax=Treponema sp. TaxID=166 RepID=UPI0025E5BD30|nr:AzlC family ABC transporter permease [Treponema sp.]MBQ8679401.1 AzlC family ABC transporter permease [Treponema sp.]